MSNLGGLDFLFVSSWNHSCEDEISRRNFCVCWQPWF